MLFIDTETTGLPKNRNSNGLETKGNWPDIVSVSWAIVKDGVKQRTKYFVISPEDWTIPDDSTRIHGITMEDAFENGVTLSDVMTNLSQDLKKVDSVVAHNLEFDKNVLFNAYKWRLGVNPWPFWPANEICTMKLAEPELKLPSKFADSKRFKSPTLGELYEATFSREPPDGLHNSQQDVEVLIEIFKARWLLEK